jgi:DNA polymerase-1
LSKSDVYFFDIETDGLLDEVTTVHSLVIKSWATGERWSYSDNVFEDRAGSIADGLAHLSRCPIIVGHNVLTYDIPALEKITGWELPAWTLVRDTHVMSRVVFADIDVRDMRLLSRGFPGYLKGKQTLQAWGVRLGVLKGDFHENADWSRWTIEMQRYCEQDVNVAEALWEAILRMDPPAKSVNLEHEFSYLLFRQEQKGFRVDEKMIGRLHAELVGEREQTLAELQEAFPPRTETMKTPAYYRLISFDEEVAREPTKRQAIATAKRLKLPRGYRVEPGPLKEKLHPFNPGSGQQAAARLRERYGWVPTKLTETGLAAMDEEVLKGLPYQEAPVLLKYATVKKRLGQIVEGDKAWLKYIEDGRIHGGVNPNGTVTGRCTHMAPNMAQVPKVKKAKSGILMGYAGGWGWEFRSVFTADDGWLLVGADASGLELRMLAHYLARHDGGKYGRELLSGDIHVMNMEASGLSTRDQAKTFIYAYLYGAGDWKLGLIYYNDGPVPQSDIDDFKTQVPHRWERASRSKYMIEEGLTSEQDIARHVRGQLLRDSFEKRIDGLAELIKGVRDAAKERGYLTGLDGRKLYVRSQHSALNTLLQAGGSIAVKQATVLAYRNLEAKGLMFGPDWAQVAHVHDELQDTTRPEIAEEVGQTVVSSIKEAGVFFNLRIPLDGEYHVGRNWAETH